MVETPSLILALAAGMVSFLSPCCLPLVPGYLAAIAGPDGHRSEKPGVDRAMMLRSLVFVGTFSLIFIFFGLTATAIGGLLFDNQPLLQKMAGAFIFMMGLLFIGSAFILRLNRDWRPPGLMDRAGRGGPVVAGAAFAIAWTPCVGPTLGAILGLASVETSTPQAALLLGVYSTGLAIPFLLSTVAFDRLTGTLAVFKRHYLAVQLTAGTVLVAMGVLVYTNQLFRLNIEVQQFLERFGLNFFQSV